MAPRTAISVANAINCSTSNAALFVAVLCCAVFLLVCCKALLLMPCLTKLSFLIDLLGNNLLQQYWNTDKGEYKYVPVTAFADAFQQTATAQRNMQYLDEPYVAPNPKCDEALITHKYALSGEYLVLLAAFMSLA